MSLIARLKEKYRYTWIGTVEGKCRWIMGGKDTGVTESVFWNLYVRGDGKRKFEVTGDVRYARSAHVVECETLVKVWKSGGPVPPLRHRANPQQKPPKLLVFPGGKGAA